MKYKNERKKSDMTKAEEIKEKRKNEKAREQ
jgi:hypothetical protein